MTHKRMRIKHLQTIQAQGEKYIADFKRSERAIQNNKKPLLNIITFNQLKAANFQFGNLNPKYQTKEIRQFCRSMKLSYRNPFQYFFFENKSFSVGEIMSTLVRHHRLKSILKNPKIVRGLFEIITYFPIVRPIKNWKPKKRIKGNDLLWDLFLHVFVAYPNEMPSCLKRFFLGRVLNDKEMQGEEPKQFANVYFLLHVANGFGLHSFSSKKQPLQFNSKMNFYFKNSPKEMDLSTALKWTLLKNWKLKKEHIQLIIEKNYSWTIFFYLQEAFHFFARNQQLKIYQIEEIFKFLFHKKNGLEIKLLDGRVMEIPFIFPNFSFKKKTVSQVFRAIEKWKKHVKEKKEHRVRYYFSHPQINDFEDNGTVIRRLTNSAQLLQEGKIMEHCVATYTQYCVQGRGSIWTVERWREPFKKLATIEVTKHRSVVQIKGKRNKYVGGPTYQLIKKWCEIEDLKLKIT